MLYTSFVFTKVSSQAIKRLTDDNRFKTMGFEIHGDGEFSEFGADMNDEQLYEICCIVSDFLIKDIIAANVKRMLNKSFDCFNRDEVEHICNVILDKDFVREIPGRVYVYLKMNRCINPGGFYLFMCRDIHSNVNKCTLEEANKIFEINEKTDMIETLKYFSEMSLESVNKVVLIADSHRLEIKECYPPRDDICCEFSATETDVLAELIALNPARIEIHGKDDFRKNEISSVIEAVFENRIEYR